MNDEPEYEVLPSGFVQRYRFVPHPRTVIADDGRVFKYVRTLEEVREDLRAQNPTMGPVRISSKAHSAWRIEADYCDCWNDNQRTDFELALRGRRDWRRLDAAQTQSALVEQMISGGYSSDISDL